MKKLNTKKFDNLKKFESERLKSDDMFVVTGGHTCNTGSVCGHDGNDTDGTVIK